MSLSPEQALAHLRTTIESQGPNTPNRHYGRNQWEYLIQCCDTIERFLYLAGVAKANGRVSRSINNLLEEIARMEIEEMDDMDEVSTAWVTAEDITSRLAAVLKENKYWWESS